MAKKWKSEAKEKPAEYLLENGTEIDICSAVFLGK
jgi:hypothetical protein